MKISYSSFAFALMLAGCSSSTAVEPVDDLFASIVGTPQAGAIAIGADARLTVTVELRSGKTAGDYVIEYYGDPVDSLYGVSAAAALQTSGTLMVTHQPFTLPGQATTITKRVRRVLVKVEKVGGSLAESDRAAVNCC